MWKERIVDKDKMSKRRKSKLVFCLFGPLISWCFNGLNDKKICLELSTSLTYTYVYIYIYIYIYILYIYTYICILILKTVLFISENMFQSIRTSSSVAKSIIKTTNILNLYIFKKCYSVNKSWKVYIVVIVK